VENGAAISTETKLQRQPDHPMSQPKDKPSQKPRRAEPRHQFDDDSADMAGWARTLRETVESVVIAFVLAFLFRTFEAEAFVIPTGSMAPTLQGRHLDIECPKCHFQYRVGARSEEQVAASQNSSDAPPFCVCPNCRYQLDLLNSDERKPYPTYNGDRILVSKFSFDFTPPERWNVIVFKYPHDAKTNYIKRLIGLPGEVIRIRDGDIAASTDGGKTFPPELVHRDFTKLRAMMQVVYDDDYEFEPFVERGWPHRWQNTAEPAGPVWTRSSEPTTHRTNPVYATTGKSADGHSPAEAWLRYTNYVPAVDDWKQFGQGKKVGAGGWDEPTPQPINDFSAYDVGANSGSGALSDMYHGRPPVEDLAVECQADVGAAEGKIVLELVKRQRKFQCVLDLAAGTAELVIPWMTEQPRPKAEKGCISRTGHYKLFFANVDHGLTLAIDGHEVQFDRPTTYQFPPEFESSLAFEQAAKSAEPHAAIGSSGAGLQVSHLLVLRDVYYTYEGGQRNMQAALSGSLSDDDWICYPPENRSKLLALTRDVRAYDQFYFVGKAGDPGPSGSSTPILQEDQFLPLGDNSPLSSDGRVWHFVDRRLLIGKALFIYWPHGLDTVGDTKIPFPFGMFPNFHSMGFVR